MIEELNDPIEVILHGTPGNLQPIRFRRKDRVYKIKQIYNRWRETSGSRELLHITAVTDSGDSVELVFDLHALTWTLRRMV